MIVPQTCLQILAVCWIITISQLLQFIHVLITTKASSRLQPLEIATVVPKLTTW